MITDSIELSTVLATVLATVIRRAGIVRWTPRIDRDRGVRHNRRPIAAAGR
ncbi:MAG: hypothetical protein OXU71_05505 [Gammaproteobacteria bacterium]|nr:hypothetical protein [Gammaproteobacteria bacterium]